MTRWIWAVPCLPFPRWSSLDARHRVQEPAMTRPVGQIDTDLRDAQERRSEAHTRIQFHNGAAANAPAGSQPADYHMRQVTLGVRESIICCDQVHALLDERRDASTS